MSKNTQRILAESADDYDEEGEVGPALQVFTVSKTINEFSVYLSSSVVEPSAYDELCHLLRTASKNDHIKLYLNTPGGTIVSGLALIQAMRESQATVTTILACQGFSMGALIFLSGDILVAPPNAMLMFHHYSGGVSGKGNEQEAEIAATKAWFHDVMHNTCSPFLTKKEIRLVLEGKDIWMGSAEINERLQNMKKGPK